MIDISFLNGDQGGSIQVLSGTFSDGTSTTVEAFPADDDPITVEEIECIGHQFTLNGELFRWHKPVVYIVRLSVIPNSNNDESLSRLLEDTTWRSENGKDLDDVETRIIIKTPNMNIGSGTDNANGSSSSVYTFEDGNIKSGSPSVSVDSEGKIKSKRYTFVFGKMTHQ